MQHKLLQSKDLQLGRLLTWSCMPRLQDLADLGTLALGDWIWRHQVVVVLRQLLLAPSLVVGPDVEDTVLYDRGPVPRHLLLHRSHSLVALGWGT